MEKQVRFRLESIPLLDSLQNPIDTVLSLRQNETYSFIETYSIGGDYYARILIAEEHMMQAPAVDPPDPDFPLPDDDCSGL